MHVGSPVELYYADLRNVSFEESINHWNHRSRWQLSGRAPAGEGLRGAWDQAQGQ